MYLQIFLLKKKKMNITLWMRKVYLINSARKLMHLHKNSFQLY